MHSLILPLLALPLAVPLAVPSARASSASPETVTVCASGCDHTSIQAAVDAAGPGDTIAIGPGTYVENVVVDKNLELVAAAGPPATGRAPGVTIDAAGSGTVVTVRPGAAVRLAGIALTRGRDSGLRAEGAVTLEDCWVVFNEGGYGGGIAATEGSVFAERTLLFANRAASGGGIAMGCDTTLMLRDCRVSRNEAGGRGGGLADGDGDSLMRVERCTFTHNRAGGDGGAIDFAGGGTLVDSTFESNQSGGSGGALHLMAKDPASGRLTLTGCSLAGNRAGGAGGGIATLARDVQVRLSLVECSLRGNGARFGGGAVACGNDLVAGGTTSCDASRCLFEGNRADGPGGAVDLGRSTTARFVNSTLSGNQALEGGALASRGMTAVDHCSLVANRAALGSAIHGVTPGVGVSRSVFAGHHGLPLTGGQVRSVGSNVYSDSLGWWALQTDLEVTHVGLLRLDDNGGPTATHALAAWSPAVDAIRPAACSESVDQRGAPRPSGPRCDAGAFERDAEATSASTGGR